MKYDKNILYAKNYYLDSIGYLKVFNTNLKKCNNTYI